MRLFGALVLLCIAAPLLLPLFQGRREYGTRYTNETNLRAIAVALHNYHDTYGEFPAAYTVDSAGNRLHSWRTLLLPFLNQEDVYRKIDLTKAWNDPVNAEALETQVLYFQPPRIESPWNYTPCLALVTSESVMRPVRSLSLDDVSDPHDETLIVIEVSDGQAVPWMSPEDADEVVIMGLDIPSRLPRKEGRYAITVDGRRMTLDGETSQEKWRAMISANGNDSDKLETSDD